MASSVFDYKSRFQDMLRPFVAEMGTKGVTPNDVTVPAIALSVIYAGLLCVNIDFDLLWLFLPIVVLIRITLNNIEGMLASDYHSRSRFGIALKELGNVISDTALLIPFLFKAPDTFWAVAIFIFASLMTEMCGLIAYMMCGERRDDGPLGTGERSSAIGFLGFLIGLSIATPTFIFWFFMFCSVFAILTCKNRIQTGLRLENAYEPEPDIEAPVIEALPGKSLPIQDAEEV